MGVKTDEPLFDKNSVVDHGQVKRLKKKGEEQETSVAKIRMGGLCV